MPANPAADMMKLPLFAIVSLLFCTVKSENGTCGGAWSAILSLPQCELEVGVMDQERQYTSPCFPNNYTNNLDCTASLQPYGDSLTQIILNSFTVESWSDYLKVSGPNVTDFFLFVDANEGRLFITGYPKSELTATFVSDSSTTFKGFNGTLVSATESEVLDQYNKFSNLSAVQILGSPLFITSPDDVEDAEDINVVLMNVPNTSLPLSAAWEEYAGLIGQSATVQTFASTANGFTANWTMVQGVQYYNVKIIAEKDMVVLQSVNLSANIYVADGLPSGSVFLVNVTAMNKLGRGSVVQGNATTDMLAPSNILVTSVGQTYFRAEWSAINGASSYKVYYYVQGEESDQKTYETTEASIHITDLLPGTVYVFRVAAVFSVGNSSSVMGEQLTTAPGNVTNIQVVDITTSSARVDWNIVHGATSYSVVLKNSGATVKQAKPSTNTTVFYGIDSGTNFTLHITASNDGGNSVEKIVQFSTAVDKCKGVSCGANASCGHISAETCACNEGFVGDPNTYCEAYCSSVNLNKEGTELSFNLTQRGRTAYSNEKCNGASGRSKASAVCTTAVSASGRFTSSFALDTVFIVGCNKTIKSITDQVNSSIQISAEKLEPLSTDLQVITSGEKLSQDDVTEVAQYIDDIKNLAEQNENVLTKKVFEGIANTADNLIESNSLSEFTEEPPLPVTLAPNAATASAVVSTTLSPGDIRKKDIEIKQKILKSLTVLAQQVVIPNGTNEIHIETKSMIIQVYERPIQSDNDNDTSTELSTWFAPHIVTGSTSETGSNGTVQQPLNISIPSNVFANAESQMKHSNNTKPLRLSFFLHKDATLFPSSDNVSMVIAATVGTGLKLTNLKPEVEIEHNNHAYSQGKHNSPRPLFVFSVEMKCVFWNFETASWSSEGCCLSDTTYPPTCKCNHLTNFAMVVSQTEVPADVFLDIVSDIGCVLSIFGLFFTIVVHLINKDIRKRRPTIILIHICSNLFLSYTFFLIGISLTKNPATCTAMAGLLHFLMLNAWTWMVIYTHDMYRSLVKVFNKDSSNYLTKCTFFGYGVPFLIVVVNMAITVGYFDGQHESPPVCNKEDALPISSAYKADNMCWLHKESLYFGFLLPVGLMLIFNMVVYILLIRSVVWERGKVQSSAAKVTTKTNLMISITLASTTGLTWIIGYLMLLSGEETYLRVMSWLFCIANTSQGLIIFLLTCFRNKTLRNIWWQPIRKRLPRSGRILTMLSPRRQEFDLTPYSTKSSEIGSATNEPSTGLTKVKSGASEVSVSAVSEANL